jgi:ECF transporter S component (folate family)
MFSQSAKELKKVRVLTFCAMFAALAVVLEYATSIDIGPYIKIGFSDIPNQLVDLMFGPITGSLFAGVLDIIKFAVKPSGTFFFGFTFNAMLAAFIYGCFYYKKPITFWRILVAKGIVALIVNVILNTLWLDMLYGKGFFVILPARALKNLIMWPINSVIFFLISTAIERTGVLKEYIVRKA